MKRYVDGYVIPLPKKKLGAYKKMADKAGKIWMKHGALQYFECVGEDLNGAAKWGCLPFPKMTKAKANETVVFAFVVYKSRAHRDRVNTKVMQDPAMGMEMLGNNPMPFEMKRMAAGGFETLVALYSNKRK